MTKSPEKITRVTRGENFQVTKTLIIEGEAVTFKVSVDKSSSGSAPDSAGKITDYSITISNGDGGYYLKPGYSQEVGNFATLNPKIKNALEAVKKQIMEHIGERSWTQLALNGLDKLLPDDLTEEE
jgi:hypothetical protein